MLFRSEAAHLDLGNGKNLVMLLTHGPRGDNVDQMGWLPTSALIGLYGWDAAKALLEGRKLEGSAELRGNLIPTLVTFSDLADPASARVVEPTDAGFAAAFGPGHRLSSVTLEMVPAGVWPFNLVGLTGTPVTHGIEGKVAWIGDYPKETTFERRLRETGGGGGGSLMPGLNLRRN